MPPDIGRIDVHAHLLPGMDDGCQSYEQSLECARMLVDAGYTHAFCTAHVWPSLPGNTVRAIVQEVDKLQAELEEARIPLHVLPGGEINLLAGWPRLQGTELANILTYNMEGRIALFDFWAEQSEDFAAKLEQAIAHFTSLGLALVLAHPERVAALQRDPAAVNWFLDRGVRLQMNTWCLTTPAESPTYRLAHQWLTSGLYFLLGTDCHDPQGLPSRIEGLRVAESIVGRDEVDKLTRVNPRVLAARLKDEWQA